MSDSQREWNRREVLKATGTAIAAASVGTGTVSAASTGEREQPDYVYYDQATLDRFKQLLITTDLEFLTDTLRVYR